MANILLAEDDTSMLNFLVLALERAEHDVTATQNGLDALKQLEEGKKFDLLLTDIVMPGMDGVELARKVTDISPDIKVMFITGFAAMAIDPQNDDAAKKTKLMSKPFHLNDLVEQVEQLLTS